MRQIGKYIEVGFIQALSIRYAHYEVCNVYLNVSTYLTGKIERNRVVVMSIEQNTVNRFFTRLVTRSVAPLVTR